MDPTDTPPAADDFIDFDGSGTPAAPPATDTSDGVVDFLDAFNDPPAAVADPAAPVDPPADPAAPVDPPAAAADDIDAIPEPEKASAAAKENFNKIKESAKGYKAKLEAAEKLIAAERAEKDAKIADYEAKLAAIPELTEKAKFAEDAEKELAISRVEGTREYKATITDPLLDLEKDADELAERNSLRSDDILDAITERDPAKQRDLLKEILSSLDIIDQNNLVEMARKTQALLTKRDGIRKNAAAARKELEEISKANETKVQKAAREEFESAATHAVGELKKRIPFVSLTEGETADNVFETVAAKAKTTDFDAAPAGTKAFAATAALLLPRVTKQLVSVQAENATLKARIAASNSANPTTVDPAAAVKNEVGDFFSNMGIVEPGSHIKAAAK